MSTLYELTGAYQQLLDMIESGEYNEVEIMDYLQTIDGEIEDKADNYAKVIKELEGSVGIIKAEIDRLSGKKSNLENNIKKLKQSLEMAMRITGKTKFKTDLFGFGIQKNPAALVIDSAYIPAEYMVQKDPEPDKAKIKEELKLGVILDFAHLEQSESLRIR